MEYEMSVQTKRYLKELGTPYSTYFAYNLYKYFETGKDPKIDSDELRDLWFYIKIHELSKQLLKDGSGKTFSYIELCSELNTNSKKFENKKFKLKKAKSL